MSNKKSMYKRSKECANLNEHNRACLECVFWDSAYNYCRAYKTGYETAEMRLLQENLLRVES